MAICLRTIKSIDERGQEILDGAMKLFSEKGMIEHLFQIFLNF